MLHELPDLEDILHKIHPTEEKRYFDDNESMEIYDTCVFLMEEFVLTHPKIITEPDFEDIFDENISELMHCHFDFDVFYTDEAQDEMDEIIEVAKQDFYKEIYPLRSYPSSIILNEPDYDFIEEQINVLRNKPQPVQRTKEWYEMRQNLITASNAYKAFESQCTKNQLIFEKCQISNQLQQNLVGDQMVNVNSTLHWGQKYEPLSVMYYEMLYDTKVEDFGCIQHDKYKFLGASPDGINVDPASKRYGRMLEIKNIVNREIDGIPKKEYWIQMQLQMEVCDLDECDFLETRFTEYTSYQEFVEDTISDIYEDEEGNEFKNITISKDNKQKGIIVYFHTKEGKPYYEYKPLDIVHPSDIELWEEKAVDLYQCEEYKYVFVKFIYWKLDEYSCVLVERNRQWFQHNIGEMEELWAIVLKERQQGYDHRAPNSKKVKKDAMEIHVEKLDITNGCLLKFLIPQTNTNTNTIQTPLILDLELDLDLDNNKR